MSRLHYSFNSGVAAALAEKSAEKARSPRIKAKFPSRRYLRSAMENLGLFAFGFGSTNLIIHFVAGFLLSAQMLGGGRIL
ncbi:MAG: hypothetical protein ACR650_08505 [Methylocystis sp.]